MTSIYRARKERFVQVPYSLDQDDLLSDAAVRMYLHIFKRPNTWKFHINTLSKYRGYGVHKTRRILNEFIQAGYLYRTKKRDGAGQFDGVSYIFFDVPISQEDVKIIEESASVEEAIAAIEGKSAPTTNMNRMRRESDTVFSQGEIFENGPKHEKQPLTSGFQPSPPQAYTAQYRELEKNKTAAVKNTDSSARVPFAAAFSEKEKKEEAGEEKQQPSTPPASQDRAQSQNSPSPSKSPQPETSRDSAPIKAPSRPKPYEPPRISAHLDDLPIPTYVKQNLSKEYDDVTIANAVAWAKQQEKEKGLSRGWEAAITFGCSKKCKAHIKAEDQEKINERYAESYDYITSSDGKHRIEAHSHGAVTKDALYGKERAFVSFKEADFKDKFHAMLEKYGFTQRRAAN